MEKKVLVAFADGSEELEAVCIVDVLRRTKASVTFASVAVEGLHVTGSKGVKLIADKLITDCVNETYDLIALPGGMPGAEHLRDSKELTEMVKRQNAEGRLIAAICSAPAVILYPHGLLAGRQATCHPGFSYLVKDEKLSGEMVVVDGNLVTSRGAGTAVAFSLKLVELLYGAEVVREVARGMVITGGAAG